MKFFRKILFFLIVVLAFLQSEPGNAGDAGKISIQFENSLLSVYVKEANLLDVIEEFEKVTHINVQVDSLPEDEILSVKFDSLPMQEALGQLFPYGNLVLDLKKSRITSSSSVSLYSSLKSWFWNTFTSQ